MSANKSKQRCQLTKINSSSSIFTLGLDTIISRSIKCAKTYFYWLSTYLTSCVLTSRNGKKKSAVCGQRLTFHHDFTISHSLLLRCDGVVTNTISKVKKIKGAWTYLTHAWESDREVKDHLVFVNGLWTNKIQLLTCVREATKKIHLFHNKSEIRGGGLSKFFGEWTSKKWGFLAKIQQKNARIQSKYPISLFI